MQDTMNEDRPLGGDKDALARTLVAALSLIAAADGKIDARELDWMGRAMRAALNAEPDARVLAQLTAAAGKEADRAFEDVRLTSKALEYQEKMAVLYACALMMYADGSMDSQERDTLANISGALQLERTVVEPMRKKAMSAAPRLFAGKG